MKVNIIDIKNDVAVFFAAIPDNITVRKITPTEREQEILSASNERIRREKYSAWLLLEYAIKSTLGISLADAKLYKSEGGKWKSELCEFSISHSDSCVAVAISHAPVGIDIEPTSKRLHSGFERKILTEDELSLYLPLSDDEKNSFLLTRWCMKEAIFKKNGKDIFKPSKISTADEKIFLKRISISDNEYICIIASDASNVRSFKEVRLN